jgi:Zn finger protein HypA/HybF involved in hydrogenase expression
MTTIKTVVNPPKTLSAINVTIGPMAGISADILAFCLPEVANLYGYGKPRLVVNHVPARMRCVCGIEYGITNVYSVCPACGSLNREPLSGQEFSLDSVETEETNV